MFSPNPNWNRVLWTILFVSGFSLWGKVSGPGAEPAVERFVTLRDGSVLRVELGKVPHLKWDERAPAIAIEDVSEVRFSKVSAGAVSGEIRNEIARLRSADFEEREAATRKLRELAPGFTGLLGEIRDGADDPEIRQRLALVLSHTGLGSAVGAGFDLLISESDEFMTGDVGDWKTTISYRGHPLTLSRENVSRITRSVPKAVSRRPSLSGSAFEIIRSEAEVEAVAPPMFRTRFKKDPGGRAIKDGEDISKRFAAAGFQIESSLRGTSVSLEDSILRNRGILTIRFHVPGLPDVPASVAAAGFHYGSAFPGIKLEAYDGAGSPVGGGGDGQSRQGFLAFRASVPVTEIRFVPSSEFDAETGLEVFGKYLIGEFFFTRPTLPDVLPEKGWGVFDIGSRERILARGFEVDGGSILLRELSYGAKELRLEVGDLSSFSPMPPRRAPAATPDPEDLHWFMLMDGSRIRTTRKGHAEHRWATFPEIAIPSSGVAALWGKEEVPTPIPVSPERRKLFEELEGGVLSTSNQKRGWSAPPAWIHLKQVTFGEKWIDSPDRLMKRWVYETTPVVWFDFPPEVSRDCGLLTLTTGDEIVIGPESARGMATVSDVDAKSVQLRIADQEVSVPMEMVVSIGFPKRERETADGR